MPINFAQTWVVGGLAIGGTVAIGVVLGHPAAGMAASTGSLGLVIASDDGRGWLRVIAEALAAAMIAWMAALGVMAASPFGPLLITGLAGVAVTIGGYSRPLAVATTRFVLVLLVTVNVLEARGSLGISLVLAMAASGLAAAGLSFLAGRRPSTVPSSTQPTHAQLRKRWKRLMTRREGWRHPAPLLAALAAAETIAAAFPGHHAQWIALTIVLLIRRTGDGAGARAVKRVGGTILGAALACAVWIGAPTGGLLVGLMTALGVARSALTGRRPLAHAAVMTLLVALMASGGGTPEAVLVERVGGTALGAILALAAEAGFARLIGPAA